MNLEQVNQYLIAARNGSRDNDPESSSVMWSFQPESSGDGFKVTNGELTLHTNTKCEARGAVQALNFFSNWMLTKNQMTFLHSIITNEYAITVGPRWNLPPGI
jgi:hypothetical protein